MKYEKTADLLIIKNCAQACRCQSVHILLLDDSGNLLMSCSVAPTVARGIAADLMCKADMADVQRIRSQSRLT